MILCPRKLQMACGLALVGLGVAAVCGCGGAARTVGIAYTPAPDHPEVLASATEAAPIRVCIAKVDVKWEAGVKSENNLFGNALLMKWSYTDGSGEVEQGSFEMGVTGNATAQRDGRLWENLVRSQIGALLMAQAAAAGKRIELVDRDQLEAYLRERDLKLADIVASDRLTDKARLLPIDLYIFASINGQTTVHTKLETNKALSIASWAPYAGPVAAAMNRPKQRIRRTITFTGNLRAQDAATARIWVAQEVAGQTIEDLKAKPWESDRTELDLMPDSQRIKEKLDYEARRFVGRMVPTPLQIAHTVRASSDENSARGVRHLALGEDEAALAAFEAALAIQPTDHRSAFGAGVACERLGRLRAAAEFYHQAVMNSSDKKDTKGDGEGQYLVAHQRVQERIKAGGADAVVAAKHE